MLPACRTAGEGLPFPRLTFPQRYGRVHGRTVEFHTAFRECFTRRSHVRIFSIIWWGNSAARTQVDRADGPPGGRGQGPGDAAAYQ